MPTANEISQRIDNIVAEWNRAELAIKQAEQVNDKIVNPAIYELRYAGRRLVEALSLPNKDPRKLELLKDAHFDCCRARHDAMDAATSKVEADLSIAKEKLSPSSILKEFPKITTLLNKLGEVRGKIAVSRKERNNRDAIYATIQTDHMPEIIEIFQEFKASEPLLIAASVKEQELAKQAEADATKSGDRARRSEAWAIISTIIAALSLVAAIYFGTQNTTSSQTELDRSKKSNLPATPSK